MSLRDALGLNVEGKQLQTSLYKKYGVVTNPFPSSGQTSDHPRKPGQADVAIQERLRSFINNSMSQVVVLTGIQGVGKTNLLEYYRKQLPEAFAEDSGFYVIQYLADPEPRFTGVILKILDELGVTLLNNVIDKLVAGDRDAILHAHVSSPEFREALHRIATEKAKGSDVSPLVSQLSEYLHGVRMLKSHYETLGVRFSLTTQEQKTSALRDLVGLARELGLLKGILLFMDELEKLGDMTLRNTLGYLSAIRALIDALPHALFLVLAMTETARADYQRLFPSLASRFGNPIALSPLSNQEEAVDLGRFYLTEARARGQHEMSNAPAGNADIVSVERMRTTYDELEKKQVTRRGYVVQREYLDALHVAAQQVIAQ
jgi:hypothetical protein